MSHEYDSDDDYNNEHSGSGNSWDSGHHSHEYSDSSDYSNDHSHHDHHHDDPDEPYSWFEGSSPREGDTHNHYYGGGRSGGGFRGGNRYSSTGDGCLLSVIQTLTVLAITVIALS